MHIVLISFLSSLSRLQNFLKKITIFELKMFQICCPSVFFYQRVSCLKETNCKLSIIKASAKSSILFFAAAITMTTQNEF